MSFLINFNIENGNKDIPKIALISLFRKWCKSNSIQIGSSLNNTQIKIRLSHFLSFKNNKYFSINKDLISVMKLIDENTIKPKKKTTSKHYQKHIMAFISAFDIKSGDFSIQKRYLFNLYDKWCYCRNKKSCSYLIFNQLICLFIKDKKVFYNKKELEYYFVNQDLKKYFKQVGSMMLINNEEFDNARSKKEEKESQRID